MKQHTLTNSEIAQICQELAILLLLMLVVIVILLSQVLPVFDEVYASLGAGSPASPAVC